MTQKRLDEIAGLFSTLAAGQPDERLRQVIFQQLAVAFSNLAAESAPSTGWAAATGTASRTSFDTATVSTPQLAARVKALIDDLITRGEFSP